MTDFLEHAVKQWQETNTAIGEASGNGHPADPYRFAALLDGRAGWWLRLAELRDTGPNQSGVTDVYAVACHYAAILDQEQAARVRYQHGIPTLFPRADHSRLHLNDLACRECGRIAAVDTGNECPDCPWQRYGVTPRNAAESARFGPGTEWEWTGLDERSGDDG